MLNINPLFEYISKIWPFIRNAHRLPDGLKVGFEHVQSPDLVVKISG